MSGASAAASAARFGVVFLHGLGDRGSSWAMLEQQLAGVLPGKGKWVFPDAPIAPVSVNGGMQMTSWFDLNDFPVDVGIEEFPDDIDASVAKVQTLVEQLVAEGIPSERIVVGGFSQGGAIALQSALRLNEKVAGIVCLSGWLLMADKAKERMKPVNADTPIFWGHGAADPVVLPVLQSTGVNQLSELGYKVTPKTYPGMAHSSGLAEMRDLAGFVRAVLGE